MKKSILALGAAAALGGLGFAGSAHALAVFAAGTTPASTATTLELNPGGTGHYLFTPYFSAQGTIGSMWSITNTDATNGKAVKVRFRSASNSDDVLDFTVFLSPLDVWTAGISQAADGTALITTADKSCTLPVFPAAGVSFKTNRLPSYATADQLASLTREGYAEMLEHGRHSAHAAGRRRQPGLHGHQARERRCALHGHRVQHAADHHPRDRRQR